MPLLDLVFADAALRRPASVGERRRCLLRPGLGLPRRDVSVRAASGVTDSTAGRVTVEVFLESEPPGARVLPAQPCWADGRSIGRGGRRMICGLIPQAASDIVQWDADLTVSGTALAGSVDLIAESMVIEADQLVDIEVDLEPVTLPVPGASAPSEPPVTETSAEAEAPALSQAHLPAVVSAGDRRLLWWRSVRSDGLGRPRSGDRRRGCGSNAGLVAGRLRKR